VRAAIESARDAGWLARVQAACDDADAAALALVAAEVPTEADALDFWRAIAERHPSGEPWLRVRLAEAELAGGDTRRALDLYMGAFEQSPELALDERERVAPLAEGEGGEILFRWQLAELRAYLELIPDDEDWIRERYSELLDAYRDQPERLAQLYELGARIRQLEQDGVLPQAMVVRPPRKR
jgi:hypothetical protein